MNFAEAVILGIIQGLTEFLPVSSSAHLSLAQHFMGRSGPGVMFVTTALHLGSLAAILVYYRRDVMKLFTERRHELWWVAAGSIPAAVAGLLLKKQFEAAFESPRLMCALLVVTGGVLAAADRARERVELAQAGLGRILLIGLAQALAILPGLSRSGMTISAGFLSGIRRDDAVRFAFFLGLPVLAGATAVKMKDALTERIPVSWDLLGLSIAITFVLSLLAIRAVHGLKRRLRVFAVYCVVAGAAGLVYFLR